MDHLIDPAWFAGRHWLLLLGVTVAAMAALIKGAGWLVEGAAGLAQLFGIPKVIIGATVVSLGTTSPECAVSVMAAWAGNSGLALGNAVGSIVADTALIFGFGCVLTVLPADRFVLNRQGWVQAGAGLLLAGLCYSAWLGNGPAASIGRPAGVLLLSLLLLYMIVSVRWARLHPEGEPFLIPEESNREPVAPAAGGRHGDGSAGRLAAWAALGLAVVLLASHVLICAVAELALQWHVPQVVVAGTIVAVGTSLPELTVGLTSILKGHKELLVGNVIGADILNVLFVIGAAAVARPLPIIEQLPGGGQSSVFLYLHLPFMLAVLILFRFYIWHAIRCGSFRRWYGWPLLGLYALYAILQYAL